MTRNTSTLAFSGWGQPHDALALIAPEAEHIAYYQQASLAELFETLGGRNVSCVIGWSLGAQLAIRAIEQGALKTEKLVLLSPPYQFVACRSLRVGMPKEEFITFKNMFTTHPEKVLRQFGIRIAKGDHNAKEISHALLGTFPESPHWGYWLEELGSFSCRYVDFSPFPETTIIHGHNDAIVDVSQIGLFLPFLSQCHIEIIENCAHAPHLHDPKKVRKLIKKAR